MFTPQVIAPGTDVVLDPVDTSGDALWPVSGVLRCGWAGWSDRNVAAAWSA
jgi:hypothetical protein